MQDREILVAKAKGYRRQTATNLPGCVKFYQKKWFISRFFSEIRVCQLHYIAGSSQCQSGKQTYKLQHSLDWQHIHVFSEYTPLRMRLKMAEATWLRDSRFGVRRWLVKAVAASRHKINFLSSWSGLNNVPNTLKCLIATRNVVFIREKAVYRVSKLVLDHFTIDWQDVRFEGFKSGRVQHFQQVSKPKLKRRVLWA